MSIFMKKIINSIAAIFIIFVSLTTSIHAIEIKHEMGVAHFEKVAKKVVALDWALTETLLALDVKPIAMPDIKGYKEWVSFPEMPEGITDIGDRREPNLELLAKLKPDVILMNSQMAPAFEQLNEIAPVIVLSIYSKEKKPLLAAERMTTQLGILLGKEVQAQALIDKTNKVLTTNGEIINQDSKPLLFTRFLNQRTLRVHSEGSLVHDTITRMGLKNSWDEKTNIWGFTKTGIEKLGKHQHARLMILGPVSQKEKNKLFSSALWKAMQFNRDDSAHILPSIWTFGGLISAQRFSEQVVATLKK